MALSDVVVLSLAVAGGTILALPLLATIVLAREARCGSLLAEDARGLGFVDGRAPAVTKPGVVCQSQAASQAAEG